jgi:hypothetical protein
MRRAPRWWHALHALLLGPQSSFRNHRRSWLYGGFIALVLVLIVAIKLAGGSA